MIQKKDTKNVREEYKKREEKRKGAYEKKI